MHSSLFDRVAGLVEELGVEKQAAAQEKSAETGIPDPGGMEGATSHPSKKTDDNLRPSSEGFQSADNERIVKDQIPDSVDSKSDETPDGAPKATDTQQGQGVDKAKPTGEDPSAEDDYKGKLEGDKRVGDQGGTTHPARGDYGEKYSADAVRAMDDDTLLKHAADLGNELTSDIANGFLSQPKEKAASQPSTKQAAAAGEEVAEQAGELGAQLEKIASDVIQEVVKSAYHQADLVSGYLSEHYKRVQKQAESETEDPTSGAGEGEDYGSDKGNGSDPTEEPPAAEGEESAEGAEELLAAMGGSGMEGMGGEEAPMPEAGGMPGAEAPMPEAGGMPGGEPAGLGAPPEELGGMDNQVALQQLAMALLEAGIDPAELAALGSPQGEKIAAAVHGHRRSGAFELTEAKRGSAERKVRDYMKGFVLELYKRSQA